MSKDAAKKCANTAYSPAGVSSCIPCPPGYYCAKPIGSCDGPGVCTEIPEMCTRELNPVCGCDGRDYSNACAAAQHGISVQSEGTCPVVGGEVGDDCGGLVGLTCGEGLFCAYGPGDLCGAADALGTCAWQPEVCTALWDPVCGCDGETYESACAAGTEKVSVLHEGACEVICEPLECPEGAKPKDEDGDGCDDICVCPDETLTVSDGCDEKACESKSDCKNGFFCLKSDGLCEGVGKCAKFPEACEAKENEVCGCDGEIYLSECHAHQAAVNLAEPETCK